MAAAEQPSPLKGKRSSSSSVGRNECDSRLVLPNNLELGARAKPSKKQRNKEKFHQLHDENVMSSPEVTDFFSAKSSSYFNYPRAKSNTATWLKDQMMNDEKSAREVYDSEEMFSEPEIPAHQQNLNLPTNLVYVASSSQDHQKSSSKHVMENDIKSAKEELKKKENVIVCKVLSHIQDFIAETQSLCQNLGLPDEPVRDAFLKIKDVIKEAEGERDKKVTENGFLSGISPSSSSSKVSNSKENVHRDSSASVTLCNEEEQAKCNHLLEEMKVSEERVRCMIMGLKLQESLLNSSQKKGENKATVPHGAFRENSETGNLSLEHAQEQSVMNSNLQILDEVSDQISWVQENIPYSSPDHTEPKTPIWKDSTSDIKQIHLRLDHIKKQVQSMQQLADNKNMTGSFSSDDCAIADVGERVAAVEWERKKLNNKLVELHEKKQLNHDLLRELYYLKDVSNAVSTLANEEETNVLSTTSDNTRLCKVKDKRKKKICKPQSSLQHLKVRSKLVHDDNGQNILESPEVPISLQRNSHPTTVKRDNMRKEQNSAFPARRHYEAEGRANEDSDIPVVSGLSISPALDNPELQDKIRKLQVAQKHVKVLKDIVVSIQESRNSGSPIPAKHMHLLAAAEKLRLDDDSELDSRSDREYVESHDTCEGASSNAKEASPCGLKLALLDLDNSRIDESEETGDSEATASKEHLAKLQSQFQQLMQVLPSSDKNDDPIRSSGEGAYTQIRNSGNPVSQNLRTASMRNVTHQDNLQLTRQNIATMESQQQASNSNFHNRDCNTIKKDNINNLSGKMGKLSIQNPMNRSYPDVLTGTNNMDTMSSFSYELNHNQSLPNEIERKTIIDILKRDKKKQKLYERNHDNQGCCNSSVESEPLEGSNCALAIDMSAAGVWGGSSTQEYFEDEIDEPIESLEDHEEEDKTIPCHDKSAVGGPGSVSQFSGQNSNMHRYVESVPNVPDKRQRNIQQPAYGRGQNRPAAASFPKKPLRSCRKPEFSNTSTGLLEEMPDGIQFDDCTDHQPHHSMKFMQQLKNHLESLNSLCQNQVFHDRNQAITNYPNYFPLPNVYSVQSFPEFGAPYNQQLLLSLSQCYHALYMQQLEIQHLQRCMWQNMDIEGCHQVNSANNRENSEDANFRPYYMSPLTNPVVPSNPYSSDQVSPMSSSAYYQMPLKPFPFHGNASYSPVSGSQPVRAVIHPTSQEATSQETLNNQVPPRTRANNFWDNFRSYSRQNLLSTNNAKRNENVGSPVTPQVRQVHPLVCNENSNRVPETSRACCNVTSFFEINRSVQNPEQSVNHVKKSKFNSQSGSSISSSSVSQRKDVSTNIDSTALKSLRSSRNHGQNIDTSTVPPVSNASSINLIQLHPNQDESKVGSFASICPTTDSQSISHSASDISSSLCGENQSEFLIGLFQEAQALKSEELCQKALKIIRDLAKNEKRDPDDSVQNKIQNDQALSCKIEPNQSNSKTTIDTPSSSDATDIDKRNPQIPPESSAWSMQNLPTAAISPLNKHGTSRAVSTGAVRKKPKLLSTCFWDSVSNGQSCSREPVSGVAENSEPHSGLSPSKTIADVPLFITENILSDLFSILPCGQVKEECPQTFWTSVNNCVIDSLRTRFFLCNIPLSRKSLLHLRQTVDHFLSRFSGMKFSECESHFLSDLEEFLYENLTCFIANGRFAPMQSMEEDSCSLDLRDRMQELCIKMPVESNDCMKELSIKMSSEENVPCLTHCKAVQQNAVHNIGAANSLETERSIESDCAGASAEDVGCDFSPEAETEPEVETGTEADLAEADQSPGQGTVTTGLPPTETWSSDQSTVLNRNVTTIAMAVNDEDSVRTYDEVLEGATGNQVMVPCIDSEVFLDDIPTKLCPSEEEQPTQLKEDPPVRMQPDENSNSDINAEISCDPDTANHR